VRPVASVGSRAVALALAVVTAGCLRPVDVATLRCTGAPCSPSASFRPRQEGGCCTNSVQCTSGLACAPDAGVCVSTAGVTASCPDGGCQSPALECGRAGASCAGDYPCCTDNACSDAGACVPSCGGYGDLCHAAGGGPHCCAGRGLLCLPGNSCGFPGTTARCSAVACTPLDAGGECALGAWCSGAVSPDPCLGAGLICGQFGSCRQPLPGETCQPNGPACQALEGSAVSLVCESATTTCAQPCLLNNDCAAIDQDCEEGRCVTRTPCLPLFGICMLGGAGNDGHAGVCLPNSAGQGRCQQVAEDGTGATGDRCDVDATRQSGALCDSNDFCSGGVCLPLCDATSSTTLCAGGLTCVQYPRDAIALGVCSVPCDVADSDGGGCVSVPGKPQQKCLPAPSGTRALCVAALGDAGGAGAPCDPTLAIDPCVAGASCYRPPGADGGTFSCYRLCQQNGSACPDGLRCDSASSHCLP